MVASSSRWCIVPRPVARPRIRLFCFPFAGSGSSVYRGWVTRLPAWCELVCVELPGRETRVREPLCDRLGALMPALADALALELGNEFAFFGHSMGALIAFEMARWLRRHGGPTPRLLAVSGRAAPHLPNDEPKRYLMNDEQMVESLREMNGIPEIALQHREMMEFILPVLRADLTLCETHEYAAELPLSSPIVAFGGRLDRVTQDQVEAWSAQASRHFAVHMFDGDHFFVRSCRDEVIDTLSAALENALVSR